MNKLLSVIASLALGLAVVLPQAQAADKGAIGISMPTKSSVLEFSRPAVKLIEPLYDVYSFRILPWLGEIVARDADSYRYLAESIRMHPDQATLRDLMAAAGLEDVRYHNLSGGIVALHVGYRY